MKRIASLTMAESNALRGCGNHEFRKCVLCNLWDDQKNLAMYDGGQKGKVYRHKACAATAQRDRGRRNGAVPRKPRSLTHRKCPCCKETKPLSEFHNSKRHAGSSPRCMACGIAYGKQWYAKNKNRKSAYDIERRRTHRESFRAANKRWSDANPGIRNSNVQTRRARLANRTPGWVTSKTVRPFYESAARVSACLGIPHNVDHAIPLYGRRISGLHVPGNLRVIPAIINQIKCNKFEVAS